MIDLNKLTEESLKPLFRKGPTERQLQGVKDIVFKFNKDPDLTDLRCLAYILGTAIHETASTMEPIEEYGKGKTRPYGVADPISGKVYYGRGYVQITWRDNYERFSKELKVDLVNKPEMALRKGVALSIMFIGMKKGMFTGKKLEDYFYIKLYPKNKDPFVDARAIINGTDCAERIANYSKLFLEVLEKARV